MSTYLRALPRITPALLGLALAACASGGGGNAAPARRSTSDITVEEMGARSALDLHTLIQQLRPGWLRARGQATPSGGLRQVQVVIDGTVQPSGLEVLRTLRGTQVTRIRYWSGQDATTRFGLDVEAGVIEVITLR